MSYYLWYSQSMEEREYSMFCAALEFGFLSILDIPHWNTATIAIAGEPVSVHYNLASQKQDAYDSWTGCADKVYLGLGRMISSREMKASEIAERMRELGMIIPSVLLRSAR